MILSKKPIYISDLRWRIDLMILFKIPSGRGLGGVFSNLNRGNAMITILPLDDTRLSQFKQQMQLSFKDTYGDELPERHINDSMQKQGAIAYMAVENGEMIGGAIVVINGDKGELDFLYVKSGIQSKGVGQTIWQFIESHHKAVRLWHLLTPYSAVRNLHFYINRLGFVATEFYCDKNPNPHYPKYAHDLMLSLQKQV